MTNYYFAIEDNNHRELFAVKKRTYRYLCLDCRSDWTSPDDVYGDLLEGKIEVPDTLILLSGVPL